MAKQQSSKKELHRTKEVRLFNVKDVQQGPGTGGSHVVVTLLARYHIGKSRKLH